MQDSQAYLLQLIVAAAMIKACIALQDDDRAQFQFISRLPPALHLHANGDRLSSQFPEGCPAGRSPASACRIGKFSR